MSECKKTRWLFDDVFLGELTRSDQLFLDRHLKNCPKCRAELDQNTSLLSMIKGVKKDNHEPPSQFWKNFTATLHQRMLSEDLNKETKHQKQLTRQIPIISLKAWTLKGIAATVLLIIGIFIGRQFFAPTVSPNSVSELTHRYKEDLTANLVLKQKILKRTDSFLNRSRVILLSIENFDPKTENAGVINLPYQKQISRGLLKEAIILKQNLSKTKQQLLIEIISELEVILLQIANMDSGTEIETLQLVGDGQYIRDILFNIRTYDIQRFKYKKI